MMDEITFSIEAGKVCVNINKPTQKIMLNQMQAYYFIKALETGLEKISLQRKEKN